MKFEMMWRDGFNLYERVYDTELGKSIKRQVNKKAEFFVPAQYGRYSYVLDKNVRLDKRYGTARQGSEEFGYQSPIGHHVRDEYWDVDASKSKYNKDINTWFIDIETRVSVSYKEEVLETSTATIKHTPEHPEELLTIQEIRARYKDGSKEALYYNNVTDEYVGLSSAYFMVRNTGFPVPDKALEEISMFQILDTKTNTMYLLGTKDWVHQERYLKYGDDARYEGEHEEVTLPFDVKYMNCENELKLIQTFLALFKHLDPLLLLAWNGNGFDYPYIYNRMKRLGMDTNELSNYGSVQYRENEFQGRMEYSLRADGHYWMDLKEVYQKFDFGNHADFSLDTIAYDELKDRKVNHKEYTTFDDFYTGNYVLPENPTDDQKRMLIYQEAVNNNIEEVRELGHSEFVWYGLKDTWLLKRIDDKRKFIDTMLMIASMTGTQMLDTLGTVRVWSQYLSNLLYQDGLVLPKRVENEQAQITGGYVQDPIKGKHDWVMSVDVNSMYPLLGMVSFNMSPETYIPPHLVPQELQDILRVYYNSQEELNILNLDSTVKERVTELLQKYNIGLGINGACFRREEEGIIPKTVRDIYLSRRSKQKELRLYLGLKLKIEEELRSRAS